MGQPWIGRIIARLDQAEAALATANERAASAERGEKVAMVALINACNDGWADGTGALESYLRDALATLDPPPTSEGGADAS